MTDPSTWEVYLVTDRTFSRGRSTREIVEAAVRGGASAVQLREKDLDTRSFLAEGRAIRTLLKDAGVPLIINDRIDIALALDAEGVHLGRSDMPADVARRLLGPDLIIGLSVEEPRHVTSHETQYVDYLGISPVFLTATKTELEKAWGLEGDSRSRDHDGFAPHCHRIGETGERPRSHRSGCRLRGRSDGRHRCRRSRTSRPNASGRGEGREGGTDARIRHVNLHSLELPTSHNES